MSSKKLIIPILLFIGFLFICGCVNVKGDITYNSGTNTILVTGGSLGNEYDFEDIYQADLTGGWGVVNKTGYFQYFVNAYLTIGDTITDTWFKDINKQVVCHQKFLIREKANVQFGDILSVSKKLGANGCSFKFENTGFYGEQNGNCSIRLYDCYIVTNGYKAMAWMEGGVTMWSCITNTHPGNILPPYKFDVANTISRLGDYGVSRCPTIATNWIITNPSSYALYFAGGDIATLRDLKIYSATYDVYCRTFSGVVTLIDCECGWNVGWRRTCSGTVYRDYSFNLKVMYNNNTFVENATVILLDKNNDVCFSENTSINGNISEQIVSYGYYKRSSGFNSYSPHTLIVNKSGYDNYTIIFDLDEKIDWTIVLSEYMECPPYGGDAVIRVYGTEYKPNVNGTIYAQVLYNNSHPANGKTVYLNIWNTTSKFIDNVIMNYITGSHGCYYYDFTVPSVLKVFMVDVNCSNPLAYGSGEFHVSKNEGEDMLEIETTQFVIFILIALFCLFMWIGYSIPALDGQKRSLHYMPFSGGLFVMFGAIDFISLAILLTANYSMGYIGGFLVVIGVILLVYGILKAFYYE